MSKPFGCICGFPFDLKRPDLFSAHFVTEHLKVGASAYPPPLDCIYCESKFESPEKLGHHYAAVHVVGLHGKSTFYCPRCKTDIPGNKIDIHVGLVHPNQCVLCLQDQIHPDNHDLCMKVVLDALNALFTF